MVEVLLSSVPPLSLYFFFTFFVDFFAQGLLDFCVFFYFLFHAFTVVEVHLFLVLCTFIFPSFICEVCCTRTLSCDFSHMFFLEGDVVSLDSLEDTFPITLTLFNLSHSSLTISCVACVSFEHSIGHVCCTLLTHSDLSVLLTTTFVSFSVALAIVFDFLIPLDT